MLQFTPAYFISDEPNLEKKNCSCERALKFREAKNVILSMGNDVHVRPLVVSVFRLLYSASWLDICKSKTKTDHTCTRHGPSYGNPTFCIYAKTKEQISCAVTDHLIGAFVFATEIIQSLDTL